MPSADAPSLVIEQGTCYALFAYDIGLAINLDEAERHVTAIKERGRMRHKARAPHYFEYRPAPLRLIQETASLDFGDYRSSEAVEVMLYDFGAVTVIYRIPINGPFEGLLSLSESLYENERLLADSRHRLDQLVRDIRLAIDRPSVSPEVEDYLVFSVEHCSPSAIQALGTPFEPMFAHVLRSERTRLSDQEIREATSCRISFSRDDTALIDWNAAIVFGEDMDDVRAVLEFVNVELLEMRTLDEQLDQALDQGYVALTRKARVTSWLPGSHEAALTQIGQLQVDSAVLFERVANTLKLLGDQYLARVYRLASQRFHIEAWDASIIRKLQTLDSIYGKMSDRATTQRMEVLEWIIIALITISIAVSFLPMTSH
ncbi:MAG: hypothetical protein KF711_02640 [Nitrospira sp.]|nr:hypothetical protein [Nitrospira sp.]MBX3368795.1 hypothetical protein [Nitrospira sp.]